MKPKLKITKACNQTFITPFQVGQARLPGVDFHRIRCGFVLALVFIRLLLPPEEFPFTLTSGKT